MKLPSKRRPIDFVNPQLSSERVERMWDAIERAQHEKPPARATRAWLLAAAACAAVALGIVFVPTAFQADKAAPTATQASPASTGDVIVTERATDLKLPDGSSLTLDQATKLSVLEAGPAGVRLQLERGRVLCDVVHREGQNFHVQAADLTVHVKGTRFSVELTPGEAAAPAETTVRVERGLVELTDKHDTLLARLSAGQTWSGRSPSPSLPLPPAGGGRGGPAQGEPSREQTADAAAIEPAAKPERELHVLDAGALLERANAARIAGRTAEAAADYERLRARFPHDVRAGLSAFELARIRLDSLHDARGALAALQFALAHNRGGFLQEDAEALRVDALERVRDLPACRAARAKFLTAFPHSAHTRRVSRACPE